MADHPIKAVTEVVTHLETSEEFDLNVRRHLNAIKNSDKSAVLHAHEFIEEAIQTAFSIGLAEGKRVEEKYRG